MLSTYDTLAITDTAELHNEPSFHFQRSHEEWTCPALYYLFVTRVNLYASTRTTVSWHATIEHDHYIKSIVHSHSFQCVKSTPYKCSCFKLCFGSFSSVCYTSSFTIWDAEKPLEESSLLILATAAHRRLLGKSCLVRVLRPLDAIDAIRPCTTQACDTPHLCLNWHIACWPTVHWLCGRTRADVVPWQHSTC